MRSRQTMMCPFRLIYETQNRFPKRFGRIRLRAMRYGGQEERKGRKQGTQRREDENGENDFYLI